MVWLNYRSNGPTHHTAEYRVVLSRYAYERLRRHCGNCPRQLSALAEVLVRSEVPFPTPDKFP